LTINVGRLLLLDWVGPHGPWDDHLLLIFDGGVLGLDKLSVIEIADQELSEFAFMTMRECVENLRPDMFELVQHAYQNLNSGSSTYRETFRA
jgi:hypothetical protein